MRTFGTGKINVFVENTIEVSGEKFTLVEIENYLCFYLAEVKFDTPNKKIYQTKRHDCNCQKNFPETFETTIVEYLQRFESTTFGVCQFYIVPATAKTKIRPRV